MSQQDSEPNDAPAANPRKRSAALLEEDEEEMKDKLFPAAAAMKRRRIQEKQEATYQNGTSRGESTEPQAAAHSRKPKPPKKEIDIQEVVRKRREAEENAARRDEELFKTALDDANISELRNLAVVEDMDLPTRRDRALSSNNNDDDKVTDRWDPRWNGRKNFKKFRRQGAAGPAPRRGQSVIVPLEEVKKKGFGIGDDYWLESETTRQKKRPAKDMENNTVTVVVQVPGEQSQPIAMDSESATLSRTTRHMKKAIPRELITDHDSPATLDVDIDAPRTTRSAHGLTQTQPEDEDESVGAGAPLDSHSPRGALTSNSYGTDPGTSHSHNHSKPLRRMVLEPDESESDDSADGLKFRFKRRRK